MCTLERNSYEPVAKLSAKLLLHGFTDVAIAILNGTTRATFLGWSLTLFGAPNSADDIVGGSTIRELQTSTQASDCGFPVSDISTTSIGLV